MVEADNRVTSLLNDRRLARADQDPCTSCADALAKISSLTTAAASKDLVKVLALATSLADTPTSVRCSPAEKTALLSKENELSTVLNDLFEQ